MPDITRRFDDPPGAWFDPANADTEGPIAGKILERDKYDSLLQHFYDMRQWDRRGIPTRTLIGTLGLEAEAAGAEKYGRLE
jgi:aldehyde:ferredoxin oxidoreductase